MKKKSSRPITVRIRELAKGGFGKGQLPNGKSILVRPGPPESLLQVFPHRKKKGQIYAVRLKTLEYPPYYVEPPCEYFGLCGGCSLQELPLPIQRKYKLELAIRQVAAELEISPQLLTSQVEFRPLRGIPAGYRYRNKVEFSWGVKRFLPRRDLGKEIPKDGRFLGFHAPGFFDQIVDLERCLLVSENVNQILQTAREFTLRESAPPPWNPRQNQGFWRHLVIREGQRTGELSANIFTAPPQDPGQIRAVSELAETLLQDTPATGVTWWVNPHLSDVAKGELRKVWGEPNITEILGNKKFLISPNSFFQVSAAGAELLYQTIANYLPKDNFKKLYDLYCGTGTIGIFLSDYCEKVVGIEEIPEAIEMARKNARLNGLTNVEFYAEKVENKLDVLNEIDEETAVIVDPPRAGLHPKVTKLLARLPAKVLIYAACNPASLGRDAKFLRKGGWQLRSVTPVDLFPQTPHLELVGLFER